ncbi:MAG: symmetrical bis(5'-nucleosyl)-tetraphosphatase [Betaproteobacteria bacterium]|nr:symmetrical bis(5'-nucleosyl)-tetraphosphatase [Betaproteobacteria bacterium]
MSTYVIGDIQGCHSDLERLLGAVAFNPAHDRVWITGDLVNRGEDSLAVLRWCREHDESVTAVLGNHDLHLLAVAEGFVPPHRKDTLEMILGAPDRDGLLDWLRHRPMLHRQGDWLMVHAGLAPEWTPDQAAALAGELEAALRGSDWRSFLCGMYGNEPRRWDDRLAGQERLRCIANILTRTRWLHPDGGLDFEHKLGLGEGQGALTPWFDFPGRRNAQARVLFGHWSTLGLLVREDVVALDTGCLWGGSLSAFRLEDGRLFQVNCAMRARTPRTPRTPLSG